MERTQAIKLINQTFSAEFNRERYSDFIGNLLKTFERKQLPGGRVRTGVYIYEPYRELVESLDRLGNYMDTDGRTVEVLVVRLKPNQLIDRARTKQRNFVAYYLEHGRDDASTRDAALVAFVEDGGCSWRFSLVRMEYELKRTESGKVKTEKQLSPARRFSFLVGVGENTHTAQTRFLPILQDDGKQPTLEELSKAFSVETITDEFFEKYRELYFQARESLLELVERDEVIAAEFEEKGITVEDFAKKLLGQIVFLYFIQRKGWLGVAEGEPWGAGARDFLRQLFEGKYCHYHNFFNDILEYLFYDMLAVDKGEKAWHEKFNCRIPFLNGGLFEPLFNYDWRKTNIMIPNQVFSNRREVADFNAGTGIFDVFDRFNFTVKEDEPLEKEVAVDPELLGKVFENLLEVKDRKSKGSYYTPREIVHYMCQESLLSYLETNLDGKVTKTDLEELIRFGDIKAVNDGLALSEQKKDVKKSKFIAQLPDAVIENAEAIDKLLAAVKVCDPAVGSGAFALGMLNEIVRARHSLNPSIYGQLDGVEGRELYDLKWHAIRESIYGVDIDPGAVEIAKLRLWLSLIVDEESMDVVNPLPNLDYKIMQGNSLLETFQGTKLFDERIYSFASTNDDRVVKLKSELSFLNKQYANVTREAHSKEEESKLRLQIAEVGSKLRALAKQRRDSGVNGELFQSKSDQLLNQFLALQKQFFTSSHKGDKEKLAAKLNKVEDKLIETTLLEQNKTTALALLAEYRRTHFKPYFLWKLNFGEVFQDKGGFDVVIGNPPYIQLQKDGGQLAKQFENCGFSTFERTGDIYCLFYEKGWQILREKGNLCFITSNKWMRAGYGESTREFFAKNTNPVLLIDFAGQKIFSSATVDTNIILFIKDVNEQQTLSCVVKEKVLDKLSVFVRQNGNSYGFDTNQSWVILSPIEKRIKEKIEALGTPLREWDISINYGIKTGFNDAFIINGKKRQELITADPKSAEIIRPILRGRDIKKYGYNFADLWLLFIPWHFPLHNDLSITGASRRAEDAFKDQYPAIYRHLMQYRTELSHRNKAETEIRYEWYALQRWGANYWEDFNRQKIMYPNMTKFLPFYLDDTGFMQNDKSFMITGNRLCFLTAFLNSSLFKYCFIDNFPELQGGTRELRKIFFDKIPVLQVSDDINRTFEFPVIQLQNLVAANLPSKELEVEIDNQIFDLYGLTEIEKKVIGFIQIL